MQPVVVIAGMHRSGTSLVASLLQGAGLDIGQGLMGPGIGNRHGHYEDPAFVEFHERVLLGQGISDQGWTRLSSLPVPEPLRGQALALIQRRRREHPWGWKDPRTTLFLDFWRDLLPEVRFVLVYRSPWEVLDSLYRRGDRIFRENPGFAIEVWNTYNQALLDFGDRHPHQCLLIDINQVLAGDKALIQTVATTWDLPLTMPSSPPDPSQFHREVSQTHRPALIQQYFPTSLALYQALQQRATPLLAPLGGDPEPPQPLPDYGAWVLQDWQQFHWIDRVNESLASQLAHAQGQLNHLQAHFQEEGAPTLEEWEQWKAALHRAERDVDHWQGELQEREAALAEMRALVQAMESSKFWQIRLQWLRFKQWLGLPGGDDFYHRYRPMERPITGSLVTRLRNLGGGLAFRLANKLALVRDRGWRAGLPPSPPLEEVVPAPVAEVRVLPEPGVPPSDQPDYQQWLNRHHPREAGYRLMAEALATFAYQPLISVVMPVYNPPLPFLREAIESVQAQIYPHWELCLADDCSTHPEVRPLLQHYAKGDRRIKLVLRETNGHISQASNSALALATGEFIALLDHDDMIPPEALYEVVRLLNQHPEADMIYSDEDKMDAGGVRRSPFFKMDWCPDSFLGRMYTCHLGVYRRTLVEAIGGFRVGFEGSQDYDLVLRFTEQTPHIFHLPKILYHWRLHPQSASAGVEAKPYAYTAGLKALNEALVRRGEPGQVTQVPGCPGYQNVRYEIREPKPVSIIIPTRDGGTMLDQCLQSIFQKSCYPHFRVTLIDNGSTDPITAGAIARWQAAEPERFTCYRYAIPFNFSAINNYAVQRTQGDYLLFLNDDTEVITEDWLEAMVEQAQRPSIGAVGPLLLYPDQTIQHAGVLLGVGGIAAHSHRGQSALSHGYWGQVVTPNNYSALTGACLMCRRAVFQEVGGFHEDLAIAYNDVDFCLKLVEAGYRNIYLPHVRLYHGESRSRGADDQAKERLVRLTQEARYMMQTWGKYLEHDPCYNPNLTRMNEGYGLNLGPLRHDLALLTAGKLTPN